MAAKYRSLKLLPLGFAIPSFTLGKISMCRTALIAGLGLVALFSAAHAESPYDVVKKSFDEAKTPKPKCDADCLRNYGPMGSTTGGSFRTAPTSQKQPTTDITGSTRR